MPTKAALLRFIAPFAHAVLQPLDLSCKTVNGNTPDIAIDVDIQDYLSGRDPVLERAVEVVLKKEH